METFSLANYVSNVIPTNQSARRLVSDYQKYGVKYPDRFSKRILGGDYEYSYMKNFRDYVRMHINFEMED